MKSVSRFHSQVEDLPASAEDWIQMTLNGTSAPYVSTLVSKFRCEANFSFVAVLSFSSPRTKRQVQMYSPSSHLVRLGLYLSFVATANEMCRQRATSTSAAATCRILLHEEDNHAHQLLIFLEGISKSQL